MQQKSAVAVSPSPVRQAMSGTAGVLLLIQHTAPLHDAVRQQQDTGRQYCVGTDATVIAQHRTELGDPGSDQAGPGAYPDFLIFAFVAVIRDDTAGFQIDVTSDQRIADEIEMRQLGTGKQ